MKSWKDHLDKSLKEHLDVQIKETLAHKKSYVDAKDPSNAQLWVAIGNLSRQIFDLNLKVKFLERVLQDLVKPKSKKDIKDLKKSLKKF